MPLSFYQFCPHCGKRYNDLDWPKVCSFCQYSSAFQSSLIVVPMLCVLLENGGEGVLVVEHNLSLIENNVFDNVFELETIKAISKNSAHPWTLPFGLMKAQESVEMAFSRILKNQTGLDIDHHTFIPKFSKMSFSGMPILFGKGPNIPESLLDQAMPCQYIQKVSALTDLNLIAHPLHAFAAQKFLSRRLHPRLLKSSFLTI